jgi:hypothetical protein
MYPLIQSGTTRRGATVFDKYRARTIKQKISRVLWEVWDPIGIKDLGGPRDEYESYVNELYELLISGASDDDVAKHLLRIVAEEIELSGATANDMRPTVAALRSIELPNKPVEP